MCMWLVAAARLAGMVPGLSASAQGAATQALQRRHSGALCRAKSIHGELAGVGMCMWLAAAAWLASTVPGLSASAQGAATQALQRRHSGALSRAKSAMCCCGGWLAVRRPGPGARSWGLGAPACPRAATQPIPARPGPGTLQVAEHPPERRRRAKEPIIVRTTGVGGPPRS